jgi:SAM-dependent methyltransferase
MNKKNIWEYWRPVYGFTWALMQRSSYRHLIQALRRMDAPKVVLDIGCGTGEYIKHLPQRHTYRFVDIDPKSLAIARRECERHLNPGHWSIHCLDAGGALDHLGPVDVITVVHVISVVENPLDLIERAKRTLNHRGELLMYISCMSKRLPRRFNGVARVFGFRGVNLHHDQELLRRRAGVLNECYQYTRH